MLKRISLKALFISSLLISTAYSQVGEVYICQGIDKDNNFVGDDVTEVGTHFIWYFMRNDLQPVGFYEGNVQYFNIETKEITKYKFVCNGTGQAPYFEDRLEKGTYVISVIVNGNMLGKSKVFEVK